MTFPPTPDLPPSSEQPEAKRATASGMPEQTLPTTPGRKYPKPPRIGTRIALLCLKPEAWADAARYPLWVTLLPLALCIFLASMMFAGVQSRQMLASVSHFADGYDKKYPPITVHADGHIELPADVKQPVEMNVGAAPLLIDTTGKTNFETIKDDFATLITGDKIYQRVMGVNMTPTTLKQTPPYSLTIPETGTNTINTKSLREALTEWQSELFFFLSVAMFAGKAAAGMLWAAAMMFLISPLVMIGARIGQRALVIPRRVSYRIAAAILVPLVLFDGFMQFFGYSMERVVGGENSFICWFAVAAALAFWAGHLARVRFTPLLQKPRPRQM